MDTLDRYTAILAMPTCRLGVATLDGHINELVFLPPDVPLRAAGNELARRLATALDAYIDRGAAFHDIPVAPRGTPFQSRVWAAISAIPCGQIQRYGDIATQLGSAARAVGQACGANPLPLIVPCHRVLGSKGIGGFANHSDGWLIETKRWLLWHEGVLA